jgi:gamma-polyglutamate biosynthesis protein CapA
MKRSSRRTVSRSKNSKRNKKKTTIALVAIVVLLILLPRSKAGDKGIHIFQKPEPVTMVFVGDIMFDRGVRSSVVKNLSGDYGALYANAGYLKEADIAFGNLEGPVATGGYKVGSRFSFRMDPAGLVAMRNAGFDVVSFANNHVGDYTRAAFTETLALLSQNNILVSGAGMNKGEASVPAIVDVRDMKIGFVSVSDVGPHWIEATDTAPGILIASNPKLPEIIAAAKTQVDILVVSFHWGDEYSLVNKRQETLAHRAIDSGADIIVGHHPHVMQRMEWYNNKPIFYSLGNFIFDQYFSPHTMRGMVANVSIDPKTKEISATQFVSSMNKQYVPQALIPFDSSLLITKPFTP